jgi:hypothetical protein
MARWCVGGKVEIVDGVFGIRDDEPTPGPMRLRTKEFDDLNVLR